MPHLVDQTHLDATLALAQAAEAHYRRALQHRWVCDWPSLGSQCPACVEIDTKRRRMQDAWRRWVDARHDAGVIADPIPCVER